MSVVPAHRRRAAARRLVDGVINAAIALLALFPVLWGVSSSLKPADRILEFPPRLIPDAPTREHYARILRENAGWFALNSAIVSAATVVATLAIGIAARPPTRD